MNDVAVAISLRVRHVLLVVLSALLLVPLQHLPAAAAVAGETPQKTVTYEVRVRGQVGADPAAFARIAARTFADRRGWGMGGSLRFSQVASGGQFTLWLAAPTALPGFSSICSAQYSCRVGRHVVINDERWRTGTPTWPTVREYQHYVLNHELGHWMGLGHAPCPSPGAAAPVMLQQSKTLAGCRSSTWPTPGERGRAAARAGVTLRPATPSLVVLDRTGTSVQVLSGATSWRSRRALGPTSLPPTDQGSWTFRLGDHDLDGRDDLYAVEHKPGSPVVVHVLSGADSYRTTLLRVTTPLPVSLHVAAFLITDQDGDGWNDLLAVDTEGAATTQVHVLTGASGFRAVGRPVQTALPRSAAGSWSFATGDDDRDGVPDLYGIQHAGASHQAEVHIASGAGELRRRLKHAVLPVGRANADDWTFEVADTTGDGYDDLVAIQRAGGSGRTEMHVLDRSLTRWLSHTSTPLGPSTGKESWSFDLA